MNIILGIISLLILAYAIFDTKKSLTIALNSIAWVAGVIMVLFFVLVPVTGIIIDKVAEEKVIEQYYELGIEDNISLDKYMSYGLIKRNFLRSVVIILNTIDENKVKDYELYEIEIDLDVYKSLNKKERDLLNVTTLNR